MYIIYVGSLFYWHILIEHNTKFNMDNITVNYCVLSILLMTHTPLWSSLPPGVSFPKILLVAYSTGVEPEFLHLLNKCSTAETRPIHQRVRHERQSIRGYSLCPPETHSLTGHCVNKPSRKHCWL